MSKPIKNLIVQSYKNRFDDLTGAVVVDLRGVKSNDNNALRTDLAAQGVRVTVVKNSLAKTAFADTALEQLNDLLDGPCAMVYGGESVVNVARLLVDKVKQIPEVEFKGAIMEGELFTADEIDKLSKYPTREEAQAQVIQIILGAAGNLIGTFTGVGNQIASVLKAVEEKLEGQPDDATVKSLT